MSIFRFKRFAVSNELSSMKVNTDGVLLGAAATISLSDKLILDAGTGTGTIALMLAQRYDEKFSLSGRQLIGIDIDTQTAKEAKANFGASPWAENLTAVEASLQDFSAEGNAYSANGAVSGEVRGMDCPSANETISSDVQGMGTKSAMSPQPTKKFDLIVSNPPFFENSLKTPDFRRTQARHTDSLSYRDLLEFAQCNLSPAGRLSIILPYEQENDLLRYARMCNLFPFRILCIRTTPRKPFSRLIVEFSFERSAVTEEELTIHKKGGEYSSDYQNLTGQFYL